MRPHRLGGGAGQLMASHRMCAPDSGAGAADSVTLDFAGMTSALLHEAGGATLELDHITLRGFASKHLNNVTGYPYYRVRQMAGWPSITAEPDAQVGRPYTLIQLG